LPNRDYFHAGGIDLPLTITKNEITVAPHQNWRGQFARGTYQDGRNSDCTSTTGTNCLPVRWPGWRTNPWHQDANAPDIVTWAGGLVDGMRDESGQMYMRNRYYDPATGQFTQPDPIGLAGGLNSYGFAAGDPVSYSDPYGLRVEFTGDDARQLWNELARRANTARLSDDPEVRRAGQYLASLMSEMWHDPDRVYTIMINNDPRWVGENGGGLESADGPGRRLIEVTHQPSPFTSMSPWLGLAHELGGAQSSARGGRHQRPSVRAENAGRTMVGCAHRNRNHRFDQMDKMLFGIAANPTCKR
jgi:RHS repeat-associated protein